MFGLRMQCAAACCHWLLQNSPPQASTAAAASGAALLPKMLVCAGLLCSASKGLDVAGMVQMGSGMTAASAIPNQLC